MDISNAFAALERLIKVAAQDQFSEQLLQNARAGLDTLRKRESLFQSENAGWNACLRGEPQENNPHDFLSELYRAWWRGWMNNFNARAIHEGELDANIWQRRAEAQSNTLRAAVAIVAAPYQILGNGGLPGYLISKQEFEDLQRAVEAYKKLAEQEAAHPTQPE